MGLSHRAHVLCTGPVVFSCGTVLFFPNESLCKLMYKININDGQVPRAVLTHADPYFGGESEAAPQSTTGKPVHQSHGFPVRDFTSGTLGQKTYKVPFNLDSTIYAQTLIIHSLS